MINNMRCCRKFIGHRHITDRYVALHHKHLRNASSSLQGDAQLTLAYNSNKNSRVMLHNSLFMSSSFSKIVSATYTLFIVVATFSLQRPHWHVPQCEMFVRTAVLCGAQSCLGMRSGCHISYSPTTVNSVLSA